MPKDSFIHPISVKSFLRYSKYNKDIDFARYGKDEEFEKINNIDVPIMMRWGNDNEMILQKADELVDNMNTYIHNARKDIDYIDGANNGYDEKEELLAIQIIDFIKNI